MEDLIWFCTPRDRNMRSAWHKCEVLLSSGIKQHPPASPNVSWGLRTPVRSPRGAQGRSCVLALVSAVALARLSCREPLLLHTLGRPFHSARVHTWGSFNAKSRIFECIWVTLKALCPSSMPGSSRTSAASCISSFSEARA